MPRYKGEERSHPVWLPSPGRTRSYAAQTMLGAEWRWMKQIITRLPEFLGKRALSGYKEKIWLSRPEFFAFYFSSVQHSESPLCGFCAMWQCKCLPPLLTIITLANAVCSNWKCTPATPWIGLSFTVSGVHLLFMGTWNDAPRWLYERSRLKEVAHPALTGSGLRSKNKFRLKRKVSFREQRLSLGVLLGSGTPFGPCVVELYLIRADPDTHGNGENGGIKLADLDLEQGTWQGRAHLCCSSEISVDLIEPGWGRSTPGHTLFGRES